MSTETSVQSLNQVQRPNFKHLYADVAWYGLLAGSTIAFVAVFAARLGANSFQISLLAAGPALINLVFYIFQYIPIPLFPLFSVYDLGLSDSAISLGSSLFYVLVFLTSIRLGNVLARFGNKNLLVIGAVLYSTYPLFLGLANDIRLFLVGSIVGGVAWAVVNTSMLNRLMEVVPEDDRPAYMALHNLAMNLGILIGSFIGPIMGGMFGLRLTLLIAAGFRALSSIVLARKA